MKFNSVLACIAFQLCGITSAHAYPLDGTDRAGIQRLLGYQVAQEQQGGAKLPPGALLGVDEITLKLLNYSGPDFDALPEDEILAGALKDMFRGRDSSYGVVLIDISQTDDIRWAGLRIDVKQNPGSVGKIVCMLALFNSLAQAFPDPAARLDVLATTLVKAGDWVVVDEHVVPRWQPATGRNRFALLTSGDEFYLSEWLDHAISASANGAGAVIWREAMLIQHFGKRYPVSSEETLAFFRDTPKRDLAALARQVIEEPLRQAGIDTENLIQGSFWTRVSKQYVPGGMSYATPRELARFMFRLEQGRLVDEWSSLEMKRYLYMTKRRYRYAYAPELADAAVFFKSGSLYQCEPEEGYQCAKYMGNKRNLMNSVAIVETNAGKQAYIVTLMSNVLRVNSAWDHSRIGAAVDKVILTNAPAALKETASPEELQNVGRSD